MFTGLCLLSCVYCGCVALATLAFSVMGGICISVNAQMPLFVAKPKSLGVLAVDPTPCPAVDGSSPLRRKFNQPPPMCIDTSKRYTANMDTSLGSLIIALDAAAAPLTVNNFVVLARYHYYDGVTFHRIIKGFVCQGGDPEGNGRGGPGYRFADELPKPGRYEIGSLAMANAGPNTNGSQFFIISGAQGTQLPPQYSLFGKVVKRLDVVETMQQVETDRNDRPLTDVTINSVTISESD